MRARLIVGLVLSLTISVSAAYVMAAGGVKDGQAVSSSVTNRAFLIKNDPAGDNMPYRLGLTGTDPLEGGSITDLQREINSLSSFLGKTTNNAANELPSWSSTNRGNASDTVKQRAEALDAGFNATTGHKHTGAAGDAPNVGAASVTVTPFGSVTGPDAQNALEQIVALSHSKKFQNFASNPDCASGTGNYTVYGDPGDPLAQETAAGQVYVHGGTACKWTTDEEGTSLENDGFYTIAGEGPAGLSAMVVCYFKTSADAKFNLAYFIDGVVSTTKAIPASAAYAPVVLGPITLPSAASPGNQVYWGLTHTGTVNDTIRFGGCFFGDVRAVAEYLIDTDSTLAGNSDVRVASQKATKTYVDTGLGGKLDLHAKADSAGTADSATTAGHATTADSATTATTATSATTATNVSGTVAIGNGGTGQTSKTAAFDALSPGTTKGDLVVHDGTNNVRFGVCPDGQTPVADSTQTSGWKCGTASGGTGGGPKNFVTNAKAENDATTAVTASNVTVSRNTHTFTVTSASATAGATYTNNSQTCTVGATIASATTLRMSCAGVPSSSGTLTKASGTGDATITFSAVADVRIGGVSSFALTSATHTASITWDIGTLDAEVTGNCQADLYFRGDASKWTFSIMDSGATNILHSVALTNESGYRTASLIYPCGSYKLRAVSNAASPADINVGAWFGKATNVGTLKNEPQYALTVTGPTGWATTRAVGQPYQTSDGAWRLRLNIVGTFDSASVFSINVSGAVFKNTANYFQSFSAYGQTGSVSMTSYRAITLPGTGDIAVNISTGVTYLFVSGDVELESKPSWATGTSSGTTVTVDTTDISARYISGADQSITGGVALIANFGTKDYDTRGAVTTGAAWKFTVPVGGAGKYDIDAGLFFSAASGYVCSTIMKNGADVPGAQACNDVSSSGFNYQFRLATATLDLAVGDYIQVTGYGSANTTMKSTSYFVIKNITQQRPAPILMQPVSLRYSLNTAASLAPTNTDNTVIYGTKDFDTDNAYNATTGVFTAPSSGKYRVVASIYTSQTAANGAGMFLGIKKGTTLKKQMYYYKITTDNLAVNMEVSDTIELVQGETVSVFVNQALSSALTAIGSGGYSILTIDKVSQ